MWTCKLRRWVIERDRITDFPNAEKSRPGSQAKLKTPGRGRDGLFLNA